MIKKHSWKEESFWLYIYKDQDVVRNTEIQLWTVGGLKDVN